VQHNVNQTVDKAKNNGGKWAQDAQSTAQNTAHNIQDTAKKIYDQAMEKGGDFISTANRKVPELVREYPVYATLGGLCVGFLLGAAIGGFGKRATEAEV
jgi:ElaB/YqjD/DUF883 family membrane-anchored ribosome-binding protein